MNKPSGSRLLHSLADARRALLALLIFGVPIIFGWSLVSHPFNLVKFSFLLAGLGVVIGLRALEVALGAGVGTLRPLLVPAGLIVVPLSLSWLFTPYKGWSLLGDLHRYEGLIPYVALALFGIAVADAFSGRTELVAYSFVAGAATASFYGILQTVGLDPLDLPLADHSIASSVGHPNFFGGLVAIACPISVNLWREERGLRRAMAASATVLVIVGVLVSLSQGPWAAAVAGLATLIGFWSSSRFRHGATIGLLVAALIAAAMVGLVVKEQVSPSQSDALGTTLARGLWWRAAVDMWLDSPLVGRGPNAFAVEGVHHRLPLDTIAHDTQFADSPHSVFFSYLANSGALGAVGFLAVGVWIIHTGIKRRSMHPLAGGFLAGAVAYLVLSWVTMDQFSLAFGLWVCVGGLGSAMGAPSTTSRAVPRSVAALLLVIGFAVASGSVYWSQQQLLADRLAYRGFLATREDETAAAVEYFRKAIAVRGAPDYRAALGVYLGRSALEAEDEGATLIPQMDKAFSYLREFPDVPELNQYGYLRHQWSAYARESDEVAQRIFARSLDFDESNPYTRVLRAESLIHLGRPEEALEILQPALALFERYPDYADRRPEVFGTMAIAQHFLGEGAEARAALEQALAAEREDRGGGLGHSVCHVVAARRLVSPPASGTALEELETIMGFLCPIAMVDIVTN